MVRQTLILNRSTQLWISLKSYLLMRQCQFIMQRIFQFKYTQSKRTLSFFFSLICITPLVPLVHVTSIRERRKKKNWALEKSFSLKTIVIQLPIPTKFSKVAKTFESLHSFAHFRLVSLCILRVSTLCTSSSVASIVWSLTDKFLSSCSTWNGSSRKISVGLYTSTTWDHGKQLLERLW